LFVDGAAVAAQPLAADAAWLLLGTPGDVVAQVPGDFSGAGQGWRRPHPSLLGFPVR
jgi:hypothetical protein